MTTNLLDRSDWREVADEHCISSDHAADLLAGAPWRRLAVIGDSIAEGVGDPVDGYLDTSWADRLAAGLRRATGSLDYCNLGVRGLTASEVRSTQLERSSKFEPDLVVVSAGPNDMLRPGFSPESVEAELDTILGSLVAKGALVVTFGLLDLSRIGLVPEPLRNDLRAGIARLNEATKTTTERHRGIHVDFFDHPALDDSLFSADLLHANRRGHAVIATDVIRSLAAHHTGDIGG